MIVVTLFSVRRSVAFNDFTAGICSILLSRLGNLQFELLVFSSITDFIRLPCSPLMSSISLLLAYLGQHQHQFHLFYDDDVNNRNTLVDFQLPMLHY